MSIPHHEFLFCMRVVPKSYFVASYLLYTPTKGFRRKRLRCPTALRIALLPSCSRWRRFYQSWWRILWSPIASTFCRLQGVRTIKVLKWVHFDCLKTRIFDSYAGSSVWVEIYLDANQLFWYYSGFWGYENVTASHQSGWEYGSQVTSVLAKSFQNRVVS